MLDPWTNPVTYAVPFFLLFIGIELGWLLRTETVGKLPRPVEFVFDTPSHHRVHHGCDAIYLGRNSGCSCCTCSRPACGARPAASLA